jgi:hypothetical protein
VVLVVVVVEEALIDEALIEEALIEEALWAAVVCSGGVVGLCAEEVLTGSAGDVARQAVGPLWCRRATSRRQERD